MNNIRLKIGLAAALCVMVTVPALAQTKIGIVNLQRVFDGYWKTKQADVDLKARTSEFEKTFKDITDSYTKANEDYKKLQESMNDQALAAEKRDGFKKSAETKLKEIQEIEVQAQQFKGTAREALSAQQTRMRELVIKAIQEVVARQAKLGGYALVLDTKSESFNKTPIILYNNGENDLSTAILKELNVDAPAEFLKLIEADGAATNAPAKGLDMPDKKTDLPDKKTDKKK